MKCLYARGVTTVTTQTDNLVCLLPESGEVYTTSSLSCFRFAADGAGWRLF
jgi:hypothetical protein